MKLMHYYEVAPNQIVRSNSASFTYASASPLPIGQIVSVDVGKKSLIGVIIHEVPRPTYDTRPISGIVEQTPLPQPLVALATWMSTYYATHLAIVMQTLLPRGIQKTRRARPAPQHQSLRDRTQKLLNDQQRQAVEQIGSMLPGTALLHGITGSGKTAVYIELAKRSLSGGKSVIVLVPEIALTSQLVDEFTHHFGDIILTHSRQTEAERHLAWQTALSSTTPQVAIGPRSALFLPLREVGLIIIDEAHEPSFKQEQSPRYSALRAASILAHEHQARVVIGSATPLITDYYLASKAGRPIVELTKLAREDAVAPSVQLVDMTKRTNFKHHRFLSDKLLSEIDKSLEQNQQVLVFHNRRGSSSSTLCDECGWSATCTRCFLPLTLHADKHHLRCHVCGQIEKVPTSCPVCLNTEIIHKGIGTKLIEAELRKKYPTKSIARFDGDSETGNSVEEKYKELYDGTIDIIVGTQVIAKGLDLPNLRTVGVIQADAGLSLPDYGASERTFQLLAQVVGRVGRSHHPTNVVVQSYQPTHPAVTDGLTQNYHQFYETALAERRRSNFPPFCHLLKLTCIYKTESAAIKNSQKLAVTLRHQLPATVQILGPTPAFYERQRDTYRWQLVLKSPTRAHLTQALGLLPPTHWQFELDPISLL